VVGELVRWHPGELQGERQRAEDVDAELFDQLSTAHDARQHRRVRARAHHLRRVRDERQQHAGHAASGGYVDRLADQLARTGVKAARTAAGLSSRLFSRRIVGWRTFQRYGDS